MNDAEWFTPPELAVATGAPLSTIQHYIRMRHIPSTRFKHLHLIRTDDLEEIKDTIAERKKWFSRNGK